MSRPPTYARRVDNTSREIVDALIADWHVTDYTKAGWGVFDLAIRHRRYDDLRAWVDTKSAGGKPTPRQEIFMAETPGPHLVPFNAADVLLMTRQLVQEYLETESEQREMTRTDSLTINVPELLDELAALRSQLAQIGQDLDAHAIATFPKGGTVGRIHFALEHITYLTDLAVNAEMDNAALRAENERMKGVEVVGEWVTDSGELAALRARLAAAEELAEVVEDDIFDPSSGICNVCFGVDEHRAGCKAAAALSAYRASAAPSAGGGE